MLILFFLILVTLLMAGDLLNPCPATVSGYALPYICNPISVILCHRQNAVTLALYTCGAFFIMPCHALDLIMPYVYRSRIAPTVPACQPCLENVYITDGLYNRRVIQLLGCIVIQLHGFRDICRCSDGWLSPFYRPYLAVKFFVRHL